MKSVQEASSFLDQYAHNKNLMPGSDSRYDDQIELIYTIYSWDEFDPRSTHFRPAWTKSTSPDS